MGTVPGTSLGPHLWIFYVGMMTQLYSGKKLLWFQAWKGHCDGMGAVVKQATRRAVERREVVVRNAQDMFNFCQ